VAQIGKKRIFLRGRLDAGAIRWQIAPASPCYSWQYLIDREAAMRGAGGTSGGSGKFFLGLAMMCAGFYLLFQAIGVYSGFGFGSRLYGWSGMDVTGGMLMLPFVIGVALVFYNAKNVLGWLLALGSLVALLAGVLGSLQFSLRSMSAFDLIVILVLAVGGLGLFLASLRQG
jgi:hypothetical protein